MLSKIDLYWANALECRRRVEEAKSEADRETLMAMAKVWTLLAFQNDLSTPAAQAEPAIKVRP
jgi:hypothetical protein